MADLVDLTTEIRQRVEAIERERAERDLAVPGERIDEGR
jgi:hypothetical protein